jgi:hypothetical protein
MPVRSEIHPETLLQISGSVIAHRGVKLCRMALFRDGRDVFERIELAEPGDRREFGYDFEIGLPYFNSNAGGGDVDGGHRSGVK